MGKSSADLVRGDWGAVGVTCGQELHEAFQRIAVYGTSDNPEGYGPPFKAPWFVVDTSTAEWEVNWWGELLSEHEDPAEADRARWDAIAAIVNGGPFK